MLMLRPITSFVLNPPPPTAIYTLSLHDALPILLAIRGPATLPLPGPVPGTSTCRGETATYPPAGGRSRDGAGERSEEHTSELQSPYDLVCRLLLEKKKKKNKQYYTSTSGTTRAG